MWSSVRQRLPHDRAQRSPFAAAPRDLAPLPRPS
ncbi:hypothetical protein LTDYDHKI_CDS0022 [Exiguobacterium phage phiExGM16]